MSVKTSTKGRSNRSLTEFACMNLGFFLTGYYQGSGSRSSSNTTVVYKIEKEVQSFEVFLFDQLILRVVLNNWKVFSVQVGFTSFFDHYGQPTATTAERLNGLLDRLGRYQVIPTGVRVFRDETHTLTYLGRGDDKVAVGRDLADLVFIRPNAEQLDIVGTMIEHNFQDALGAEFAS